MDSSVKEHETWKKTLLTQLLDAVKQCQSHFGKHDHKELATDSDSRVTCLLAQFEAVLYHGLRKTTAGSTFSSLKHMTQILGLESEVSLWSCIECILSESELQRFYNLNRVKTDAGRARAWIRAALNERSLEKYLESLIANKDLLGNFYDDMAFMRDQEMVETLPQIAKGLSTMIFAINIDNGELDCPRGIPYETSEMLSDARKAPQPILSLSSQQNHASKKSKRSRPLVNVVTFNEASRRFSENEGTMKVVSQKQSPQSKVENPLLSSLIDTWNTCGTKQELRSSATESEADSILSRHYSAGSDDTFATAQSTPAKQRSFEVDDVPEEDILLFDNNGVENESEVINVIQHLVLSEDSDQVFLPTETTDNFETESVLSEDSNQLIQNNSSNVSESDPDTSLKTKIEKQWDTIESLRAQVIGANTKNNELKRSFQQKFDRVQKENESLRSQVKSYVEAVRLLKGQEGAETSESAENNQSSSEAELASYEQKLIQVACMHAELIEFNDHLVRQLNRKSRHIRRLRNELTSLRGPLSEDFSDDENMNASDDRLPTRPLVNIWIPSAFLTGKGTDVHHVYQVYIRLGDQEWNIYRRYSEFAKFHQTIKKQDQAIAAMKFPPKKSVGKKESKFVEERRKTLEQYLRNSVNQAVQNCPEFAALPINRETICNLIPFLGESRVTTQQAKPK